ncbi:MAG TPA: hypothetical protein DDZ83_08630, partial [Nitrospinae bacterium]|nr:hypothetical protein [Nitrospinota bacterium]
EKYKLKNDSKQKRHYRLYSFAKLFPVKINSSNPGIRAHRFGSRRSLPRLFPAVDRPARKSRKGRGPPGIFVRSGWNPEREIRPRALESD